MSRHLIVNADDFGQSYGINQGIIECFERGIVTSASLMVRWPAVLDAAAYARRNHSLDLGLHLDLGEWRLEGGDWIPVYEVVSVEDESEIRAEATRQLDQFCELTGENPTHIDSHQHVHLRATASVVVFSLAQQLGIPLRHSDQSISYCGAFYGQAGDGTSLPDALTTDALIEILTTLPDGVTELCCHPGMCGNDGSGCPGGTMYLLERALEVSTLCDPQVQAALEENNIALTSFASVANMRTQA